MKRLKFIITFFIFITLGCNFSPSGEPKSGPSGIWDGSAYMLGTREGGARMYFESNKYKAYLFGDNVTCGSSGSYSYNPETYIITVHSPDYYNHGTGYSCIGFDDPSPAGKWIYKGDHIISPSGAKLYYQKK
tara:strand:+ start:630 stop:1025 length:396 start_codon:yes stop_codon:yes gene_type:complete